MENLTQLQKHLKTYVEEIKKGIDNATNHLCKKKSNCSHCFFNQGYISALEDLLNNVNGSVV